jgi:hypothetical protein
VPRLQRNKIYLKSRSIRPIRTHGKGEGNEFVWVNAVIGDTFERVQDANPGRVQLEHNASSFSLRLCTRQRLGRVPRLHIPAHSRRWVAVCAARKFLACAVDATYRVWRQAHSANICRIDTHTRLSRHAMHCSEVKVIIVITIMTLTLFIQSPSVADRITDLCYIQFQ